MPLRALTFTQRHFARLTGLPLDDIWFGNDGNLNVGTLLKLYLVAVFVNQRIFKAKVSIPVVGTFDRNLRLLGPAWTCRPDEPVNGTGHDRLGTFANPRRIQIEHRYPCGLGHPRQRDFCLNAGRYGATRFFLFASEHELVREIRRSDWGHGPL